MNSSALALLTVGMILITFGGLGVAGYIPFPTLGPSQSSLCIQSIVRMATVCTQTLSTGMDSISYAGTIIAPVLNGNPVSVPQSQSQGTLVGYYFLTSGTTLRSSSASYCSGQGCSPSIPLSGVSNTASPTVVGLYLLSVPSPQMSVGHPYTYQFSITDSSGVSSTMSGSVVVIAATPTWTAQVSTYNGTFSLTGSNAVSGISVYNNENPQFTVTITNNAYVSGVSIAISPSGQTIALAKVGQNQWQGSANFAVGEYTLTATISNTQQVTAFSVRLTSINNIKYITLPLYSTSCPYATSTSGLIVNICSQTSGQTIAVSSSGCYATSLGQTATTCVQGTASCGPSGCTETDTTTVGSSGSSTIVTSTTTSSTSTTQICTNSINCSPSKLPVLPTLVFITGAIFMVIGAFVGRKQQGSLG